MQVREGGATDQTTKLPSPTDYPVALKNPASAFQRNDLQQAIFSRGPLGVMVQTGEHVVVARATIDGQEYAVRCHLKDGPRPSPAASVWLVGSLIAQSPLVAGSPSPQPSPLCRDGKPGRSASAPQAGSRAWADGLRAATATPNQA